MPQAYQPTHRDAVPITLIGMDGQPRRLRHDHWRGTLNGYQVDVFRLACGWNYSVSEVGNITRTIICCTADSRDDAAAKARKWIESQSRA